jgi:hypothetical protein
MGDACEMLIAALVTLAGVPAMRMPDNWPSYDVIARPKEGGPPQRISVKARTFKRGGDSFVDYWGKDEFDWLAIVLLPPSGEDQSKRRFFIVPRTVADALTAGRKTKKPDDRYWRLDKVAEALSEFEDNFCLSKTGRNPK